MILLEPLQIFRRFPVASAVVATSLAAWASAPILKREHREGLHGRSVVLLSGLSAVYGAASLYWIAGQLRHLRDSAKSLDAVASVERLRNCALIGLIGGGASYQLAKVAYGLHKGEDDAKQWQYWLGRQVFPIWDAETALEWQESFGDAAFYPLDGQGLREVILSRRIPENELQLLFLRIERPDVIARYYADIPQCPNLNKMDRDIARLERMLELAKGHRDLEALRVGLNARYESVRKYVQMSLGDRPEAKAWLAGSGKNFLQRRDVYARAYSQPEEEQATAIEACFAHMQGDLKSWQVAFGVDELDQDAMQERLEGIGIATEAEFKREIVGERTSAAEIRSEIARRLSRRVPKASEPVDFVPPMRSALYLSVWALVTTSMVQRSWKLFALGAAAGLGERLYKGRETSGYELQQMGVLGWPLWIEALWSDRLGGRDLGMRARTWNTGSLVGELLMPELHAGSAGMLAAGLIAVTFPFCIVPLRLNPSMLRQFPLLASALAGRACLHTLADSAPTRFRARA